MKSNQSLICFFFFFLSLYKIQKQKKKHLVSIYKISLEYEVVQKIYISHNESVLFVNFLSLLSELYLESYRSLIMNMKKRSDVFTFFFLHEFKLGPNFALS